MAVVPDEGITAFICPTELDGVTVTHRNAFMGIRGIENSVTEFDDVLVPAANVIGEVGKGLKIALSTLNTGRLSLPAMAAGSTKYALRVARQWAIEREQWGKPIGEHDPIAQKLAFIAGTAFGLDAVVDVSSRMADDARNDIRIEAAIAKLYASEMAWQAVDAMVQIRGGRAYETADSLAARGEKPVPAEQMLRDARIDRIFEGSTEIMHLMIAREALDRHLEAAGDVLDSGAALGDRARAALGAGRFYAGWLPGLAVGPGQRPDAFGEFGDLAPHVRWTERHARKLARHTFALIGVHGPALEHKGELLGRVVDIGAELFAIAATCVYAHTLARERRDRAEEAFELADLFCHQARRRADLLFEALWHNDDADRYTAAQKLLHGRYDWFAADVLDPAGDGPMMPGT
jgi:Acyl-CoA dehydrogenase, C-terminal domain